jgi:hypothetical protein
VEQVGRQAGRGRPLRRELTPGLGGGADFQTPSPWPCPQAGCGDYPNKSDSYDINMKFQPPSNTYHQST